MYCEADINKIQRPLFEDMSSSVLHKCTITSVILLYVYVSRNTTINLWVVHVVSKTPGSSNEIEQVPEHPTFLNVNSYKMKRAWDSSRKPKINGEKKGKIIDYKLYFSSVGDTRCDYHLFIQRLMISAITG